MSTSPPSSGKGRAIAALVPLFQRGLVSVLVFVGLLVVGAEVLRRVVLRETGTPA